MGMDRISRRFGRPRRSGVVLALALAAAVGLPASSASASVAVTNAGFEAGNTSGWSGSGYATTGYGGYTAPDGNYFAVVEAGCSSSTLFQTFDARQGETLSGWSFFQANDYLPYDDNGAVRLSVSGGGSTATVFSSSIGQVGSYGRTPWRQWSYTFPADGRYTISASSNNAYDCAGASAIGLDLASADTTPPAVTATATSNGAPYTSGTWTNQDVTVHFDCADESGGSGVASVTPDQTVTDEGDGQSVTGTCVDEADNSASATFSGIRVDRTAPTVTYAGNAGDYAVDQQVAITCATGDELSGVASSTCADVTGPAYSFGLGTHAYSAEAVDNAGNLGSGSTSFTVQVSHDSLCSLTAGFSTSKGVTNGLCAKLSAASAAEARGQEKTRDNILGAYGNQVTAQTGKAFTADQAGVLTALAAAL